ncbi:MAG: response regulator transcription factor [Aestuariivirga sp.]
MRILIVEDELRIATDIQDALTAGGYVAEIASEGEDAWFRGGTGNYSAIILDLGLPNLDGLTILKRWRQEGLATPVIILTARSAWAERVDGIDAGADDYLPKPFRMEELMARVRALLRRSTGQVQPIITIGPVSVDPRTQQVSVNSIPVSLTPLEYRLISYLFHNQGRLVSQTELGEALYSHDNERDSNAIEALVGRLRKKIKARIIDTRRGFGYIVTAHGP